MRAHIAHSTYVHTICMWTRDRDRERDAAAVKIYRAYFFPRLPMIPMPRLHVSDVFRSSVRIRIELNYYCLF